MASLTVTVLSGAPSACGTAVNCSGKAFTLCCKLKQSRVLYSVWRHAEALVHVSKLCKQAQTCVLFALFLAAPEAGKVSKVVMLSHAYPLEDCQAA